MIIGNNSTDVTINVVLRDSTNLLPYTTATVTDIDLYYAKEGSAISSKIDCTALAVANSSHVDGGAFNIGRGVYRIDWPDAAFNTGVGKMTVLIIEYSGCYTKYIDVQLSPNINMKSTSNSAISSASLVTGLLTSTKFATSAITATALANNLISQVKINGTIQVDVEKWNGTSVPDGTPFVA